MSVDMNAIIDAAPQNQMLQNTLMKMNLKLGHYVNPVCSVSGGSDSDTMIDLIERVRGDQPVTYVFFDTGIEYEETKRHLDDLEEKYGIKITRRKATVPVPIGCKDYGLPFLTKQVSEFIDRLQTHGFQWEDKPFETLCQEYPGCVSALQWLCNQKGEDSMHNIQNIAYLREFLFENPPTFRISGKCCKGAKKDAAGKFHSEIVSAMKVIGLRRAEGGARVTAYNGCFSIADDGLANYRPLWFWSDDDKAEYKEFYSLTYSDCYEVWGMTRTGCAGCPFGSRFEEELALIHQYEPRLEKAVNNIFGKSYAYTRAYRAFRDKRKELARHQVKGQLGMDDLEENHEHKADFIQH